MLIISLFTFIVAMPFFSYKITPALFTRITIIVFVYSTILTFNCFYFENLIEGVGIYNNYFYVNNLNITFEIFIIIISTCLLISWSKANIKINNYSNFPIINEYSIIILFNVIGANILISSNDIISIFLSIEIQSFSIYIIATFFKQTETSTKAGLKYFILGGLSSCLILLGISIIYIRFGITQFDNIQIIIITFNNNYFISIISAFIIIGFSFLFKIAAAPFHNWAPDVYDGVPTIVTSWLTNIPKISIFIIILDFSIRIIPNESTNFIFNNEIFNINIWKFILLISAIISLIIGTILGLSQFKIKRLFAYSTINHIGFILLAISINTKESIESFIFYLIQYSITNVNLFLILLAFGYCIINNKSLSNKSTDINYISEIIGFFKFYPLISFSIILILFSIAGIPPIIGFFAKQQVLYSSINNGYYFVSIIAILISVISATYYLKIIKVLFFDNNEEITNIINNNNNNNNINVTNIHSFIISFLTIIISLFIFNPNFLLNSCNLLALTLFNY